MWNKLADKWNDFVDFDGQNKNTTSKSVNGGKGSGNYGHKGRPGEVGGSGKGDGGAPEESGPLATLKKFKRMLEKTNFTSEEARKLSFNYFGYMDNCQTIQHYMKTGEDNYLDRLDGEVSNIKASECAELMKKKIQETTFDEDTILYRGMYVAKKSLDKLERNGFTTKIFQSTSLDSREPRALVEHYRDKEWNNQSKVGVMIKIYAKKGQHYMASPLANELEIVLPPGVKFKVKSKVFRENKPPEKNEKARPLVLYEVEYEE